MQLSGTSGTLAVITIAIALAAAQGGARAAGSKNRASQPRLIVATSAALRSDGIHKRLVARMRASRDSLLKVAANYQEKLARETTQYQRKKAEYAKNLISSADLQSSAQAVERTRMELKRVRQWITEDNTALGLSGDAVREQQQLVPGAGTGQYIVTRAFIRYDGPANWSLDDADKISEFFLSRFGHPMPISAMGQSPTHDRMGLDHREAMDVALRPDSPEGRGLMVYLRSAGIPFMAFRNAVRGMATGAHIHIGRPSLRIMHVRQVLTPPAPPEPPDTAG